MKRKWEDDFIKMKMDNCKSDENKTIELKKILIALYSSRIIYYKHVWDNTVMLHKVNILYSN
jgi:hypothetical protein